MTLSDEEIKYFTDFGQIIGVDEAGRGPLAGPLVACAAYIDIDQAKKLIDLDVNDSKKISAKKRETIFDFVQNEGIEYETAIIEPNEIDSQGIHVATHLAISNARKGLTHETFTVIDGIFAKPFSFKPYSVIKKADQIFVSVACASVIAKVTRDSLMVDLSKEYPDYGFEKHKGYGTKEHMSKILKHGPCEIHRRSFNPIRTL